MLLRSEHILSKDNHLACDQEDMIAFIQTKLAENIIEECVANKLLKYEITHTKDKLLGDVVKIRATLRAYNPDD